MKEIKITEATKIISQVDCNVTMTERDGVRITIFEPKKAILRVGEWYVNGTNIILYLGKSNISDKYIYGVGWCCDFSESIFLDDETDRCVNSWDGDGWDLANMKEVEKLLIKEAEKRGFKGYTYGIYNDNGETGFYYIDAETSIWRTLLDFQTGKWAEIIEEKKPLYTNSYGTEFFEGSMCSVVNKHSLQVTNILSLMDVHNYEYAGNDEESEIMTLKQCYEWILDNWDKLNK
jgi:hypothetical protein